jgi:hypothetical protein
MFKKVTFLSLALTFSLATAAFAASSQTGEIHKESNWKKSTLAEPAIEGVDPSPFEEGNPLGTLTPSITIEDHHTHEKGNKQQGGDASTQDYSFMYHEHIFDYIYKTYDGYTETVEN